MKMKFNAKQTETEKYNLKLVGMFFFIFLGEGKKSIIEDEVPLRKWVLKIQVES